MEPLKISFCYRNSLILLLPLMCSRSRTWLWHLPPQSAAVGWSTSTQTSSSGCPTSRHGSAVSKTGLCIIHFCRRGPRGAQHHTTLHPIHRSEHIQCITVIKLLSTDLFSFRLWLCLTDQTCSHLQNIIAEQHFSHLVWDWLCDVFLVTKDQKIFFLWRNSLENVSTNTDSVIELYANLQHQPWAAYKKWLNTAG